MKRLSFLLIPLSALIISGCEGGNTPIQPDAEGTTYPRVQLIEHFTGQSCGYCPAGMDAIYDLYSTAPDNYVWVTNHTYYTDAFTIAASNAIANRLGVSGAPDISINRSKYNGARAYSPGYITTYMPKEATTATSVIFIDRKYDTNTRQLTVTINGKTSDPDLDQIKLTVGITESGMIDNQADFYNTWEGWKRFTHTHAVRTYLTDGLGDIVKFNKRTFSHTFTVTLNDNWNADNCEIVAWIATNSWPVLNAAKTPIVEGTKGGEDIRHGGIEEVAVPDTYPESGTPDANVTFHSGGATYYNMDEGYTIMYLYALNSDSVVKKVNGVSLFPAVEFYLKLAPGTTTVPNGTYNLTPNTSAQVGDAIAGYRDDVNHLMDGSRYMWIYNGSSGSVNMAAMWMLVSGTVTFSDNGFEVTATTKNGSPLHAVFDGTITPKQGRSNAPEMKRFGHNAPSTAASLSIFPVSQFHTDEVFNLLR